MMKIEDPAAGFQIGVDDDDELDEEVADGDPKKSGKKKKGKKKKKKKKKKTGADKKNKEEGLENNLKEMINESLEILDNIDEPLNVEIKPDSSLKKKKSRSPSPDNK
jgi:hypothetical protein